MSPTICLDPDAVFAQVEAGMSPTGFLVWFALQSYANQDGCAWPSGETLARKTGLARSTVRLCLAQLEELRIIERAEAGRKSTTYQVIQETQPAPEPVPSQPIEMVPAADLADNRPRSIKSLKSQNLKDSYTDRKPSRKRTYSEPERKRRELFGRLAREYGLDPCRLTRSQRGELNRAERMIRAAGGNPEDIPRLCRRYRGWIRERSHFTPLGLATCWGEMALLEDREQMTDIRAAVEDNPWEDWVDPLFGVPV